MFQTLFHLPKKNSLIYTYMYKTKPINFTSLPFPNKYDLIYSRYAIIHFIPIGLEKITVSNSILAVDSLCLKKSFRSEFVCKINVIFHFLSTLKSYFERRFTSYSQSSQR